MSRTTIRNRYVTATIPEFGEVSIEVLPGETPKILSAIGEDGRYIPLTTSNEVLLLVAITDANDETEW